MATANVETVYATPDTWGNVTEYATEEGMQDIIDGLHDVDMKCSLSECVRYDLGIHENRAAHINNRGDAVELKTAYQTANGHKVYIEK
jgi:hypothetical protein